MRKSYGILITASLALALPAVTHAHCTGDCSDDGTVAINEVISCVNIGLGLQLLDQCNVCDGNEDGSVTINEIITSVNIGLGLLPCEEDNETPTPVPTMTATPVQGEPTATPGFSGGNADVEKLVSSLVGSFVGLTAIAGPAPGQGGGSGFTLPPIPCAFGGTQTFGCNTSAGGAEIGIDFNDCVNTLPGGRTKLDAMMTITTPGDCFTNQFPAGGRFQMSFVGTVEETDLNGGVIFSSEADLDITFAAEPDRSVRLSMSGTATASCIEGTATISTPVELVVRPGDICVSQGLLRIELQGESHEISYTSTGGVEIDFGANGSVDRSFANCTDPSLEQCGGIS